MCKPELHSLLLCSAGCLRGVCISIGLRVNVVLLKRNWNCKPDVLNESVGLVFKQALMFNERKF